ncbi:MAG: thiol peroxidase [Pseudoflavonifractor sp.]|nr:thiol peroxidase [Alloprevotella sp.]MCM1116628.1 thiol peroxidase [Pseudoflavonifractor sp.]
METIYFKGQPCHTYGTIPFVDAPAPCFHLTGKDLQRVQCLDFKGKTVVLNIFPSLDTDVCARSVRRFNEEAAKMRDTAVVCVSMDLPFAMSRFCTVEGIDNVIVASAFRSPLFAQKYGVMICDGPLAGLLARAVVIIGPDRRIAYRELVEEITTEPDYDAALSVLRSIEKQ